MIRLAVLILAATMITLCYNAGVDHKDVMRDVQTSIQGVR